MRLAELGADIAIVDRNLDAGDVYEFESSLKTAASVADEVRAKGVRATEIAADLTDRDLTIRTMAQVAEELGTIDIVVCNAGGGTVTFADERNEVSTDDKPVLDVNTTGTPSDCSEEMLQRVMAINLSTCMYTCMAVAPYMKAQKSGKIVTVSSTAGLDAGRGYHPYGMAKAAIIHYTRSLAQELGPFNINVNAIAPGIIRTGRLGDRAHMSDHIALRREGTIEDCANVVEFLVTDLSDYVTGKTITIDGGASTHR